MDNKDFVETNGIQMVESSQNKASAYIDIESRALNIYGNVHGGLLFALADNVAGMCARASGYDHVTLQANMNYLKAVQSGKITATATAIHRGRTTCVLEVEIVNDTETPVAKGTFTMFRV